jgi:ATP-binding cassette subfamily F protein 3
VSGSSSSPSPPYRLDAEQQNKPILTDQLLDLPPAFAASLVLDDPSSALLALAKASELTQANKQDTKADRSAKDTEDTEPPPPYEEGPSPLDTFSYIMAAAGGAASLITQVSQGGPVGLGNLSG